MMLLHAAQELALQKGFAVRRSHSADKYLLIDIGSGLPELNQNGLWFSIGEAVRLLYLLPDRQFKQPTCYR